MQSMTWLVVMFWIFAAVVTVMAFMGSRRLYWKLDAKFHRNPEANEPSDAGYAVRQFLMVVSAGALVVGAIMASAAVGSMKYDSSSDLYSVASEAGRDITSSGSDFSFGPTTGQVENAIFRAGDEDQLNVVTRGEDSSGGDQYEIRTKDGTYAVCLTVSTDWDMYEPDAPATVSTSVDDRACD